jgi:hypothetical protein
MGLTKNQRLFKAAGTALWGPYYRSELARALGNGLRTVMRWDSGERRVPDEALERLSVLLQLRKVEIEKVLEQMPKVSS